jgi:outer membrane protein assembly factor BamB
MKKSNRRSVLTTTLIISLLMISVNSIAFAQIINYHPDMGVTSPAPAYMSSDNSVYAAAQEYGNLLNEDYAWNDPHGNTPQRTGFNLGPAPDRPDVLWRTENNPVPIVIGGDEVLGVDDGVVNPTLDSFTGAPMAMDGQIIAEGYIYLNEAAAAVDDEENAIISLDPHTGAVNWASLCGGPYPGGPGASFGASSYIFKVDDDHFGTFTGGFGGGDFYMYNLDGYALWSDNTITPGAVYHGGIVAPDPVYMVFGPRGVGAYSNNYCGWDLSDPDVDKGDGGRWLWNYTIDEPGSNPCLAYGDGRLYCGSYSSTSVYALDAETGEKVWETFVESAMGYMTTYADGKLFVGCQSMHIYALDGETGEIVWQNDFGTANRAFNVWNINYAYDRVYLHDLGFGQTGAQKCLDADTGEILWASPSLFYIGYYRTVVADGKIYGRQSDQSTTTGREAIPTNFACWDAFTGEVLWNIYESIAGPIIAYGCLLYIQGSQLWCLSTALPPQDWPMFRGSVETPGFTLDKGPTDISGGPKWTYTTGAGILSSPAVVDGKVYFNSNDRYVYCLDAYTGEEIWSFLTNEPLMTKFGSSPAVVGNRVYIGPDDGNFYILDADDGDLITSVPMGTYRAVQVSLGQHNIASSPIPYGNRVYVGSMHSGLFYCLDLNGNIQWSLDPTGDADPIPGSAAIADGYIYFMDWDGYINKIDMDGNVVLRFYTSRNGDSFWSNFWGVRSYTPTVVGDRVWIGGTNNRVRCWNATTGEQIYSGYQPNVAGETSHGSAVFVQDWAIDPVDEEGDEIGDSDGRIVTQAGPTMVMARGDNGTNIWSNWGGWEVWSTPVFSGIGRSAVVYYGSDSAGITVVDATTGIASSWYTARGNVVGSPAIWDGKLYIGSYDNKLYCFEDRNTQEMAASISTDKVYMGVGDSVTVTMQLTKVPDVNVYAEIGRAAPVPPMTDTDVIVTFTDPAGAEHDVLATTDEDGFATASYSLDTAGTWKAIAWYMGEEKPAFAYGYAFSDEVLLTVAGPAPPGPDPLVASVSPTSSDVMVGESVALTASTSGGTAGFAYQWFTYIGGDATVMAGQTEDTLIVTPIAEGTFGYFCEVTDAMGQVDSTDTAEVKAAAPETPVEAPAIPLEYIYAIIALLVVAIVIIVVGILLLRKR